MKIDVTVKQTNFIRVLKDKNYNFNSRVKNAVKAAMYIPEAEYVKESPANTGDMRQLIQVQKDDTAPIGYVVTTKARSLKNFNYPLALFTGTGKLKGAADYGFTTGRVRSNTVAYGIGGIRPNKVAKRAKEKSEDATVRKVRELVRKALKEK